MEENKGGRPLIELTAEQITEVGALASYLNQEQIADYLGISRRAFIDILNRDDEVFAQYKKGKSKAIASVAGNLIAQAENGNAAAAIFYLKTQAGWTEKQTIDLSNTDGTLQPTTIQLVAMPEDHTSVHSEH
jgi:predicted DNA-binding protein (UPF0251 family)